jgi:alkylated DNA repair protein alkB family protein 6
MAVALDFDALRRAMLAEARCPPPPAPPPPAPPPPPPLPAAAAACASCALLVAPDFAAAAALPAAVPSVAYAADAVSPRDEAALLAAFAALPWVELRARRLQQYGGAPRATGLDDAAPLPPFLAPLAAALARVFAPFPPPNHALVNAYEPDEGILAHTDGPCYAPVVATLSLGADALMRFSALRRADDGAADDAARAAGVGDVVLRARSLVVTRGAAYESHAHEILPGAARVGRVCWNGSAARAAPGDAVERTRTRVSVTLRHAWTTEEVAARGGGE